MSTDDKPARGRRTLTAEERALWRGVARAVKPLRRKPLPESDEDGAPAAPPAAPRAPSPATPPSGRAVKTPTPLMPLMPLARRERQKLARGGMQIDARIDLHGMTQAQAHMVLARFLRRAQSEGARFVLVITGKGGGAGDRGVLRRQVPLWLAMPDLRDTVVGFEEAHAAHGGQGALYVRIRRGRSEH